MPTDLPADLPHDLEALVVTPRRRETLYSQPSQLGGPAPRPAPIWQSCCLRTDRAAIVYLGQMVFSGALIALCSVMLFEADGDCSKSSPYISLLSFLAGKVLASIVSSSG